MKISTQTIRISLLLAILPGLLFSTISTAVTRDPGEHFFHQSFGDLGEELITATEEGKQGIFIMFEEKDCPWCAKMKARVLNQTEVQEYFRKHFRIIAMDISGDELITDFQGNEVTQKIFSDKNRIRATPVLIFFNLQGEIAARYTGAVRNTQEFMWLGEFVVEGHYQSTSFSQFKRLKKKIAESQ